MIITIGVTTPSAGLFEITDRVEKVVREGNVSEGLCTVYIRHTSASLIIQENADPSVRRDLENWFGRLVPQNDPQYTHTMEGPDDMPSHIKASLTGTSLAIPIVDGQLVLGTWQGLFIWEHRHGRHERELVIHIGP